MTHPTPHPESLIESRSAAKALGPGPFDSPEEFWSRPRLTDAQYQARKEQLRAAGQSDSAESMADALAEAEVERLFNDAYPPLKPCPKESAMETAVATFFSFDEVFAVLQTGSFIPVIGDWVIYLSNKSVVLPEDSLEAGADVVAAVTRYEAVLYKRGDTSKPTWHGPSMDPLKNRYYQIDPRNPDSHQYGPVSDPKVAIDPADPRLIAMMSFIEEDGWVITTMKPQTVSSLSHLAQLISGRVPLAVFLDVVGNKTAFSVKEALETVHHFDVAMRHEYGVGPKERAMRLRIEG